MNDTSVTPDPKPDQFAEIAAALRALTVRFTDLIGSDLPLTVSLDVQPSSYGDDDAMIRAVDAVTSALFGHGGQVQEMGNRTYHYNNGNAPELVGPVKVRIYSPVSTEFAVKRQAAAVLAAKEAELEKLRAEVEALRSAAKPAQPAACGAATPGGPCVLHVAHPEATWLKGYDGHLPLVAPERWLGKRDTRTCVDPGDQEHDHAMCEDVAAEEQERVPSEMTLRRGSVVAWRHPTSQRTRYGKVAFIGEKFVDVSDDVATEGIRREWIVQVDGKSVVPVDGRLISTCPTCGKPHDHVHACAVCGRSEMDDGKPFVPCCDAPVSAE